MALAVSALYLSGLLFAAIRVPAVGLAALLVLFSFETWSQTKIIYLYEHSYITNVFFFCLILIAVISKYQKEENLHVPYNRVFIVTLFFCGYVFGSLSWSDGYKTLDSIETQIVPGILMATVFIPSLLSRPEHYARAFDIFLPFAATLLLLLVIDADWGNRRIQVLTGGQPSFIGNPLEFGTFAGTAVLIAVAIPAKTIKHRLLQIGAIALGLIVLINSQSRGQLFALVLCLLIWFLIARIGWSVFGTMFFLLCVVVLAFIVRTTALELLHGAAVWVDRIGIVDVWADRYSSERLIEHADIRLKMILGLLKFWSRDLGAMVFGIGLEESGGHVRWYPENIPVQILVEHGVVGSVLFWSIVAYTFSNFNILLRNQWMTGYERTVGLLVGLLFVFHFFIMQKQGNVLGSYRLFMYAILLDHYVGGFRRAALNMPRRHGRDHTTPGPS